MDEIKYRIVKRNGSYNPDYLGNDSWELFKKGIFEPVLKINSVEELMEIKRVINGAINLK